MSLTKTFVVLVVLMVCGASAFAGCYKIGELGARAMGMGGAFVAMPRVGRKLGWQAPLCQIGSQNVLHQSNDLLQSK